MPSPSLRRSRPLARRRRARSATATDWDALDGRGYRGLADAGRPSRGPSSDEVAQRVADRVERVKSWSGPDVPEVPGHGLPLRLYDSLRAPRNWRRRHLVRPRGCTYAASLPTTPPTWVTRSPTSRSTWSTVRGAARRIRRALRAERHGHRRPAAQRAAALGEDWSEIAAREYGVPRGHDRAERAASTGLRRRGRGDPVGHRAHPDAQRHGLLSIKSTVICTSARRGSGLRRRGGSRPRHDGRDLRRARRRPRPSRQGGSARLAALASRTGRRAVVGDARSARDVPAGTSSAPLSPRTRSAWVSTCRAVARTSRLPAPRE